MADNRTMAQMLQAPIEGYEDAIVVPPSTNSMLNNSSIKQPLIKPPPPSVQKQQIHGLFKHVVSISPELAFDHYLSHDRAMHPLAPHYERKTRADRGKKRPREPNASSSSTTQNPSSSSLQIDVITDDNDVESP
ncbi:hypothetical protein Tco_0594835 [Tanacetum coccineum]